MVSNNILLIVEGKKDEKSIFSKIFERYGYNVINVENKFKIEDYKNDFDSFVFEKDKGNVVLIEGPRSRIKHFLKYLKDNYGEIVNAFDYAQNFFQGVFLVYDVDHNDEDDIKEMFEMYKDESSGLLLLSSPCIEVLAKNYHFIEGRKIKHLKEYKTLLNQYHEKNYCCNTVEYIANNFNNLVLDVLDRNVKELNSNNIIEHLELIIEKINTLNERHNELEMDKCYVIYRYFTTVVYVAIAFAHGLLAKIDNYKAVRSFFETFSENNSW